MIHPTLPGNAAMAVEVLKALGAGLPLGKDQRGELITQGHDVVKFELSNQTGYTGDSATVAVRASSLTANDLSGEVAVSVGSQVFRHQLDLKPFASTLLREKIVCEEGNRTWATQPVYLTYSAANDFSAGGGLFSFSKVHDLDESAFHADASDFFEPERKSCGKCPVGNISLGKDKDAYNIEFDSTKDEFIKAQPGFKNRVGEIVNAPLDLKARGSQPCDAVEFFFDLKPESSLGRYTSDVDSNLPGILRVGLYFEPLQTTPGGTPALCALPALSADCTIKALGQHRYRLTIPIRPEVKGFGFAMQATQASGFKRDGGILYRLTGQPGSVWEPRAFQTLSAGRKGCFFRVGY